MSKPLVTAMTVTLLTFGTPATAAAQLVEIIKWLNDMSGPQMQGWSVELPVVCGHQTQESPAAFLDCTRFRFPERTGAERARRTWVASGRVGYLANNKLFGEREDVAAVVTGWQIGAAAAVPVPGTVGDAGVDGVASVDFFKFGGPSVDDFWVPTISVGAAYAYQGESLWNRVRISLRYQLFLDEFGGERFSAPGSFVSDTEGIWQFAVGWVLF